MAALAVGAILCAPERPVAAGIAARPRRRGKMWALIAVGPVCRRRALHPPPDRRPSPAPPPTPVPPGGPGQLLELTETLRRHGQPVGAVPALLAAADVHTDAIDDSVGGTSTLTRIEPPALLARSRTR